MANPAISSDPFAFRETPVQYQRQLILAAVSAAMIACKRDGDLPAFEKYLDEFMASWTTTRSFTDDQAKHVLHLLEELRAFGVNPQLYGVRARNGRTVRVSLYSDGTIALTDAMSSDDVEKHADIDSFRRFYNIV